MTWPQVLSIVVAIVMLGLLVDSIIQAHKHKF